MLMRRVFVRFLGQFQSTPDREAGRCPIRSRVVPSCPLFQSTPDREAGRCPPDRLCTLSTMGFNPRPTVRPGDAPVEAVMVSEVGAFQSTPDREAGRCSSTHGITAHP